MQLILVIIFLILSAFFSSSETALFSLNKLQIRKINISHPKSGKMVTHLLNFPRRTLITILIGNTVVNIAITSVTTFLIIQIFGSKGIGLAICLVAFFLLIFGEVVPKSLAIKNAEIFSIIVARPLEVFARVIFPIRRLLQGVSDFILYVFIKETTLKKPYITQKELKTLVSISREEGVLEEEEKEMIGYLSTWLKTGKFDGAPKPIPKEPLKIGDKIQVSAACWTGYRTLPNIGRAKVVVSPPGPWNPEHRCLFRTSFDGKMNGIFVGWSYLLIGVRNVAGLMDSKWDNTFVEHDRVKVARWQPRGSQYLKPRAALPEDIEHVQ